MTTKAEFRTDLMDWLNRSDLTAPQADRIIAKGIARCERDLRVPAMERSAAGALVGGSISYIDIPANFLETQRVVADDIVLEPMPPERLLRHYPAIKGTPSAYCRVGGRLMLRPYAASTATLFYWGEFDTLVTDADTNWLLAGGNTTLLYACLSYAADFFRMDELLTWEKRYSGERDTLNLLAQAADMGGGPQTVQANYGDYN